MLRNCPARFRFSSQCYFFKPLTVWLIGLLFLHLTATGALAQDPTHIVQPGETLFSIASKYGVEVQAIREANGLTVDTILVGQQLRIPNPTRWPARPPVKQIPHQVPDRPGHFIHTVQQGENLFRIGLRYDVHWQSIQAANNLSSPSIRPGDRLVIPRSGYADTASIVDDSNTTDFSTPTGTITPATTTSSAQNTTPSASTSPDVPTTTSPNFRFTISDGDRVQFQFGID